MTIWQKIIKYLAIIFAMMIIINIIGGIASELTTITSLFSGFKNNNENVYVFTADEINEINNLKIDLKTSNLVVRSGDTFSIHTNNRYVKQILNNESLTIKENGHFNFNSNNEVIITIPVDKIFNKIRFKWIIAVTENNLVLKLIRIITHFCLNVCKVCVKFIFFRFFSGSQIRVSH